MSLSTRNALIALGITALIVATIFYAVNQLNRARIADLSAIEDQLATDMLSLDTQFSLLAAAPCDAATTTLTSELADLGSRLAEAESQLGSKNAQVLRLKERYSLLEIRDYLLTKELGEACGTSPVTVLYFYTNERGCEECDAAGYALSYLHNTYSTLRVYSFDYYLELGALTTLIKLLKIEDTLPAFVINDKVHYGFTTLEDLEAKFPKGALATSTAQR